MRHYSLKRQKENREYSKLRVAYLEANQMCEARVSEDCQARAGEVHHVAGKIGKNLTDITNFLPVCRSCHNFIHDHPKTAMALGLIQKRIGKLER